MRPLLLIVICVLGLNSFGQTFSYSFEFEEVTEQELTKEVYPTITKIFDVRPIFTPATNSFFIKSEVDISESDFILKMLDSGYHVLFFQKSTAKNEEEEQP